MLLPDYDIIRGTSIDYMHGALLGVTKLFMQFWFGPSHKKKEYSIFHKLNVADKRLLALTPPNYITRAPRSINWIFVIGKLLSIDLFCCIILFQFCMDFYQIFNFNTFIFCSWNLSSLKNKGHSSGHRCFKTFPVSLCVPIWKNLSSPLYDNEHSFRCPSCWYCQGTCPLYIYSLFHFGDKNGYLLKLIHGTQNISHQLSNAVSSSQHTNMLILNNVFAVGSFKFYTPSSMESQLFFDKHPVAVKSATPFPSIKVSGYTIRSRRFTKEKRRNSTTVFLYSNRYFSVEKFVCFTSDEEEHFYIAFGHVLDKQPNIFLTEMKKMKI